ncbi:protein kinase domain-containing protein [Streptomyces lasiicapitis]|uniref:protein kinase domain-containing protein n=1 Tax=Streptomyces lasiicapitis TaxID=1923961 RepID=UPI003668DFAF
MPKPVSGGSATVFSLISDDGRRTAVKCFTRYVTDQERRYQKISEHLAQVDFESLSQPWKMNFEYISDEILVEGVRYPILMMDWVEGIRLSQWLSIHYQDQTAVAEVAQKFAELVNDLHRSNIAHGDLQHGNLLIAHDRTLRLVDYDGLFVPALAGERGNEIGHRNYQSPRRTLDDFGPEMDNFSAWVIYASLNSVAADPALWSQLHDADGEFLLLSEDDFSDPASSARFPDLLRHPNPVVNASLSQLQLLCEKGFSEIPRLDLNSPSTDVDVEPRVSIESTSEDVADTQPGRPSWLDGHLTTTTTGQHYPVASFQGWHLREFLLAFLGALTITAPLIMGVTNHLDSNAAILGAFVMSFLFFTLSAAARSSRREIEVLRNDQRSLDQLLTLAIEASTSYATVHEERARLISDEQQKIEENIEKNQELTRQLHRTYARIESAKNSALEAVGQELHTLRTEKESVVTDRLRPLQDIWVGERLPSFLISEAHLSGITSKHISSLAALNLHTATDIVGVRRIKGGADALLITGDGRSVKVPGIGPAKADALRSWRHQCEEEARASCLVRLPADEEAEIESMFEPRFSLIAARKMELNEEAERKRSEARQDLAFTRTRIADLHQEELEALRTQRVELDLRIADIRASTAEVHQLKQSRNLLRMSAKRISYLRYLRFLYLRW